MKRLWARIGTSFTCTDEEYEKLKLLMETDIEKAREYVWTLIYGRYYFDGDSYMPPDADDNPNTEEFDF